MHQKIHKQTCVHQNTTSLPLLGHFQSLKGARSNDNTQGTRSVAFRTSSGMATPNYPMPRSIDTIASTSRPT